MSHHTLRPIAELARISRRQTPTAFFQQCRAKSTEIQRCDQALHSTRNASRRSGGACQSFSRLSCLLNIHGRAFCLTAPARATVVKQNPRADDDGNDMTIEISERAANRLRQITNAPQKKNTLTSSSTSMTDSHLRVTVTSGGCHGFQYLMSLEGASKIDPEEDTIFASAEDGGEGHAEVVMDTASLELLKGSTIDYTTELIGSQFKIVGNPRAKSSCGCGTSFDIE